MSRFSVAAALVLWLLAQAAPAAQTDIFRCQKGGTIVFSDKPCAPDAQPYQPERPIQVVPHIKAPDLAKKYDRDVEQGKKARDAEDARWSEDYQRRSEKEERLKAARAKGEVVPGMTAQQVRDMFGKPASSRRSESAKGVRESWTYVRNGTRLTVNIKDGIVTGTTRHKGRRR